MIVGIDPHPQQHTAAALDDQGKVHDVQTFPSGSEGLQDFMDWLGAFTDVQVAVEGPTQPFFAVWLSRLLAEEIVVTPVPTQKVRERRGRRKTDPDDAVLVARVLHAEPSLPPLRSPEWLRPVQEISRTRSHLAHQLQANRMRLRTVRTPAVQASLEATVAALEAQIASLLRELERQVRAVAPQLLALPGIGVVIAGVLLAETGDVRRFCSPHRFATYCGSAPVPWESGASKHVRVNRGGNRRLNWAVHIIARTRLRTDPASRALVDRKEREGKTHREAMRVLKLYLARHVYKQLVRASSALPA